MRYGAWTVPGARETERLAWRARVDAAAREWARSAVCDDYATVDIPCIRAASSRPIRRRRVLLNRWGGVSRSPQREHDLHAAALSAPRPWRTGRQPDPRRRYSRAHRRACWRCREAWCMVSDPSAWDLDFTPGRRWSWQNWYRAPHSPNGWDHLTGVGEMVGAP